MSRRYVIPVTSLLYGRTSSIRLSRDRQASSEMCIRDSHRDLLEEVAEVFEWTGEKSPHIKEYLDVEEELADVIIVALSTLHPVAYTHLDVYKRQKQKTGKWFNK